MRSAPERICRHVMERILSGEFAVNATLPTEQALARQFQTNRMNAQRAVQTLARHGVVRRRKRGGTTVVIRPDPALVRLLGSVFSRRVHVVSTFESEPLHWNETTLREMEAFLKAEDREMVHLEMPQDLSRETMRAFLRGMADEGSAALVLMPGRIEQARWLQKNADLVFQYHRNVCLFARGDVPPSAWPFDVLSLDPVGEGVLAADHLWSHGYRRVAVWVHARDRRAHWASERLRGLRLGLQRASDGRVAPEEWALPVPSGAGRVARRLAELREPVGLVALTDGRAKMVMDAALPLGPRPGVHFGLISFDNDPRLRGLNLTTVAPPLESVGRALALLAAGKLFPARIQAALSIRIASRVVERATCPPAALLSGFAGVSPSARSARERAARSGGT